MGLALILFTCACASASQGRKLSTPPDWPLRGGVAEFQVTSYDGTAIEGRILLGATIDPLMIDGRFMPMSTVVLDESTLRVCGKEAPIGALQDDIFLRPPRPEDIVTLHPGYWYGRKINYGLFGRAKPGPGPGPGEGPGPTGGPECIEADFVVLALGGRPIATTRIRAVRNDKLKGPSDAGTPAAPVLPAPPTPAPVAPPRTP